MKYVLWGLILFLISCDTPSYQSATPQLENGAEAIALDGTLLFPPKDSEAVFQKKDSLLDIAYQDYQNDPHDLENIIWYGRRLAYMNRFNEAIGVYSKGIAEYPAAAALYRHRGHRYLSIRKFDMAITDFKKAADLVKNQPTEIEPDGIPNKLNKPLSTLQFNIWYHWALGYYLKGNYERAAKLYEECLEYSDNDDLLVATTNWLYATYQRLGETEKAKKLLDDITEDMEIVENTAYHNLLLLQKGVVTPGYLMASDSTGGDNRLNLITQDYGMANWYAQNGDDVKAKNVLTAILDADYWMFFGYIAAEADLNRKDVELELGKTESSSSSSH